MVKKVKRKVASVGHRVLHHAKSISKRTAALCFLMVLIVGALIPLGVGYVISHADRIAVTTEFSPNPEKVDEIWYCYDGNTYVGDVAQASDGSVVAVFDTGLMNKTGTHPYPEHGKIRFTFNRSVLEKADKIVIDGTISKNVSVSLMIGPTGGNSAFNKYVTPKINVSNNTYHIVIPVTPALYLASKKYDTLGIAVVFKPNTGEHLTGLSATAKVQFVDVKGFSPETTANILLGASGIILLIGGLCATPWINPMQWYHEWFDRRKRR